MQIPRRFHLDVLTIDARLYSGDAEHVMIPAANGYMGVLGGHIPYLGTLSAGTIEVTTGKAGDPVQRFPVETGFFEVAGDHTVVFVS